MPEDWKKDKVTPVFQKGKKGEPGNYRPVSFTITFSSFVKKWNSLFWMTSPSNWKRRSLTGVANIDSSMGSQQSF